MKKILQAGVAIALVYLMLPSIGLAATTKTVSGTVSKIEGSQIVLNTTSAAHYAVETGSALLVRKNGAAMQFSEIIVGDKVEVKGVLWSDNSINASSIKDNSLYAHTGTFSGKITAINPLDLSLTIESKTHGQQTIYTNNFTSFTKNASNATFKDLVLGMTASVKGVWDRSVANVTATKIDGTFRLINIDFVGSVTMKSDGSLTVVGNGNVIYGVDISKATLLSKNNLPMLPNEIKIGDELHVWGKHISGTVQIVGTKVKDNSVSK